MNGETEARCTPDDHGYPEIRGQDGFPGLAHIWLVPGAGTWDGGSVRTQLGHQAGSMKVSCFISSPYSSYYDQHKNPNPPVVACHKNSARALAHINILKDCAPTPQLLWLLMTTVTHAVLTGSYALGS